MLYRFEDRFRAEPGWNWMVLLKSCLKTCMTYTSAECTVSWWRAEELPETWRVSYQNKFGKLVYLVGFIFKKFVTMYGHMNVKFTGQFPLRIDIIICVGRSSMNLSYLSTDWNSKYLTATVPISATSRGFEYLQVYNLPILQIYHKLR